MKQCQVCNVNFEELVKLPCGHEACIVCYTITLDVTGKCEVCEKPLVFGNRKKPFESAHDDPCTLSFLCGIVIIVASFIIISVYVTK